MSDEERLQVLRSEIEPLAQRTKEEIDFLLLERNPGEECREKRDKVAASWLRFQNGVNEVLSYADDVLLLQADWSSILSSLSFSLRNLTTNLEVKNLIEFLKLSQNSLKSLLVHLREERVFKNSFPADFDDGGALEECIEKGELLVQSNYANSLACELEDRIIGRSLETDERTMLSSPNCLTTLLAFSKKEATLLAFHFRCLRPLYFHISYRGSSDPSIRNIFYRNFINLEADLHSFASSDCQVFQKHGEFIPPTATALKSSSIPLHTLGFLKALAEQSATQPIDKNWMRFHSRRQGFTFTPISVQQLLDSFDFEGFVLFLDAFEDVFYYKYILNLAISVNLYVILVKDLHLMHF